MGLFGNNLGFCRRMIVSPLEELSGLVVIDEVQRRPDLFELLRVLVDRSQNPARFLLLGSVSPHLIRAHPNLTLEE